MPFKLQLAGVASRRRFNSPTTHTRSPPSRLRASPHCPGPKVFWHLPLRDAWWVSFERFDDDRDGPPPLEALDGPRQPGGRYASAGAFGRDQGGREPGRGACGRGGGSAGWGPGRGVGQPGVRVCAGCLDLGRWASARLLGMPGTRYSLAREAGPIPRRRSLCPSMPHPPTTGTTLPPPTNQACPLRACRRGRSSSSPRAPSAPRPASPAVPRTGPVSARAPGPPLPAGCVLPTREGVGPPARAPACSSYLDTQTPV